MARCTSAAATAESTPPLSAQMARAAFGLFANGIDRGGDKTGAIPILLRAANFEHEIAQNLRAAVGVIHFRMKLDAVEILRAMFHGGDGIVRAAGDVEARRERRPRGRRG